MVFVEQVVMQTQVSATGRDKSHSLPRTGKEGTFTGGKFVTSTKGNVCLVLRQKGRAEGSSCVHCFLIAFGLK